MEFNFLTQIQGAGNSNDMINYNFVDKNPYEGVSYYRLKQVDFNGEFSYSNIESVTNRETRLISLYPNPIHNNLTLATNFDVDQEVSILIFSVTGKLINQQSVLIIKGLATLNISTEQIALGSYFVKIISNNELIKVQKIIKN